MFVDRRNMAQRVTLRSTSFLRARRMATRLHHVQCFGTFCLAVRTNFLPTHEFSIKPLRVSFKLLAGEQQATENGQFAREAGEHRG